MGCQPFCRVQVVSVTHVVATIILVFKEVKFERTLATDVDAVAVLYRRSRGRPRERTPTPPDATLTPSFYSGCVCALLFSVCSFAAHCKPYANERTIAAMRSLRPPTYGKRTRSTACLTTSAPNVYENLPSFSRKRALEQPGKKTPQVPTGSQRIRDGVAVSNLKTIANVCNRLIKHFYNNLQPTILTLGIRVLLLLWYDSRSRWLICRLYRLRLPRSDVARWPLACPLRGPATSDLRQIDPTPIYLFFMHFIQMITNIYVSCESIQQSSLRIGGVRKCWRQSQIREQNICTVHLQ